MYTVCKIEHLLGTRTGHHIMVKTLVSPLLFTFMAWMLGFSHDPEDADYIVIELDDQTTFGLRFFFKIFLCEDLVYICNRGKVQTPKSIALAVTVGRCLVVLA
jgi:hypothetical protein